jgi:hypothetical protein
VLIDRGDSGLSYHYIILQKSRFIQITERLSSELIMSLTRKSREFVVDYALDRAVSIVDSAENSNSLTLVVFKLFQKTEKNNSLAHLNPKRTLVERQMDR